MSAYHSEMALMPHIMAMERRGVHLATKELKRDLEQSKMHLLWLDDAICKKLGRQVEVDSNASLADAIEAAGLSSGFAQTPTGKRSTSKSSLIDAIEDKELLGHLLMRGALATCIRTFLMPWHEQAERYGKLYVRFNQIRNYDEVGARTGRISSSPNMQNIPSEFEKLKGQLAKIGFIMPFELPNCRKYIVPRPGCMFVSRDYAAQEFRLLAHFAGGRLLKALQDNPYTDPHQLAADLAGITRKEAKTLAFAIIYGAGAARIAEQLEITYAKAESIKKKYLEVFPDIKTFQRHLNDNARAHIPIETLAGRRYHVEQPKVIDGRLRTFEYKLLNYKIQGSAADQTKQAMYQYAENTIHGELVLSVHDQVVVQVPVEHLNIERTELTRAVNGAYQDILKYEVVSDESIGDSYATV